MSKARLQPCRLCPCEVGWTAGYVPDDGFAYHPTVLGHQVMAAMLAKALGD